MRDRLEGRARPKPAEADQRFSPQELQRWGQLYLQSTGMDEQVALSVARVQLEASLRGQATHHLESLPRYAERVRQGKLNPRPQLHILAENDTWLWVDGDNGPGQWVAEQTMRRLLQKVSKLGVAGASVRGSNHLGAAGHYAWMAASQGYIGLCSSNGPLILAPTGGSQPRLGNNPLAVAIPTGRHPMVLLDIAMSVAPRGKIALQLQQGLPLPEGWILDPQGRPTRELQHLGADLGVPIGDYKGYGLAFILEILTGVLSDAGFGLRHLRQPLKQQTRADIGHFFLVLDPRSWRDLQGFRQGVDRLIDEILETPLAQGSPQVLYPGQREMQAREDNLRRGVPLSCNSLERLLQASHSQGLEFPRPLTTLVPPTRPVHSQRKSGISG